MTVEPYEEMHAWARVYAHMGWKVFPLWWVEGDPLRCACPAGARCTSPGKHPRIPPAHRKGDRARETCRGECGAAGHGVWDATDRLDVIGAWWGRAPLANIGLAAGGSGLAVLDVDPKSGGGESFDRLLAALDARGDVALKSTLTVRTGGAGWHYVFAAPEGGVKSGSNVFGRDMPGLDTRGRGGYVVAAPSLHVSGQRYEWLDNLGAMDPHPWPGVLSRLMDPPRLQPVKPAGPTVRVGDRYAAAALAGEVEQVRNTGEGGRNNQLHQAAVKLGSLVAGGALDADAVRDELLSAAQYIGLPDREARQTIESGMRFGAGRPRGAA